MDAGALPEAFVKEMHALLGPEAEALLAALTESPVRGLRLNGLKRSAALRERCAALPAVPWCADGFLAPEELKPGKSIWHSAGLYYMQEPSAMAPAEALAVRPGERVLDLCAAPGGKTGQLAAAMQGKGVLFANEVHPGRARVLLENLERLGVVNAVVLNETPERLLRHFGRWFDAVLVDAPCSGEGMFRRDEGAVRDWSWENVLACRRRQVEILSCAAGLLRPGGRLVYSTCTFNRQENEGSLADLLEREKGLELLGEGVRLMPHRVRGEGQFYARLRDKGEGERSVLPLLPASPAERDWERLSRELLPEPLPGTLLRHKDALSLVPEGTPELKGLRVLRAGLRVGTFKTGRLEPAHALAMAEGGNFLRRAELDEMRAAAYLRGEALPGELEGWGAATAGGWPLGLCKGSNGQMKNHYPKGLRNP